MRYIYFKNFNTFYNIIYNIRQFRCKFLMLFWEVFLEFSACTGPVLFPERSFPAPSAHLSQKYEAGEDVQRWIAHPELCWFTFRSFCRNFFVRHRCFSTWCKRWVTALAISLDKALPRPLAFKRQTAAFARVELVNNKNIINKLKKMNGKLTYTFVRAKDRILCFGEKFCSVTERERERPSKKCLPKSYKFRCACCINNVCVCREQCDCSRIWCCEVEELAQNSFAINHSFTLWYGKKARYEARNVPPATEETWNLN